VKIARFSTGDDPRYGIVDGDDLVVLAGDPMFSGFDTTGERVPLDGVKLLAPVIPRSKVIAVAVNYVDDESDGGDDLPETPVLVLKPNTSIVGPGDVIQLPPDVGSIGLEGELAIVIGRVAKRVSAESAIDYIFGYTIANDVTAHDVAASDGQWSRAKGYDTFCPIGPVIETELDTTELAIHTFVDGEPRQQGNTSGMIHSIAEIVAFASDIWTLLPGDIILTGSPVGSGDFGDGQTVDVTIAGIGTLTNPARNRV
jgi:2-keto-4-pentenoate hydratase/2-oxohepta-3-ene-1,7-dioic acid hydratase in catechol pathway